MKNITTEMAARLMGKSPTFVREAMKRGAIDIGTAVKLPDSTRWNFHICTPKLADYLGITVEQLMTEVS